MRTRWIVLALSALVFGAFAGAMFSPQPAGAVSREMVQLQQQVSQLLQGQQDLRSAVDSNNAALKTLIQQSLDSINHLTSEMGAVQQTIQQVQANTGSRIDSMATQTQGLSDNLQDVQARVGKLSQQLTDVQNLLQSIDAKVSTAAPSGTPGMGGPGGSSPAANSPMPPISAATLYQNAVHDFTIGNYDMSHQEFSDYIKNFPADSMASNAQFYLGEISYAQGDFKGAITQYDLVLSNYPKSYKLAAALLKKAMAEAELRMKASAARDLRDVVRRFPGTDEARRAQAKLREVGASAAPRSPR